MLQEPFWVAGAIAIERAVYVLCTIYLEFSFERGKIKRNPVIIR
jgi:hypothetical protein